MSLQFHFENSPGIFMSVGQSQAHILTPPSHRPGIRVNTNYLFIAPMLIFIILMLAYPIFVNIQMSFYDVTVTTFRSGDAPYVGLDNYVKLLQNPAFVKSIGLSFTFTSLSICLQFSIG